MIEAMDLRHAVPGHGDEENVPIWRWRRGRRAFVRCGLIEEGAPERRYALPATLRFILGRGRGGRCGGVAAVDAVIGVAGGCHLTALEVLLNGSLFVLRLFL
jgi:hypothetical protein